MKKNILIVVRGFFTSGPQAIRFQNILPYLSQKYNIHVLVLSEEINDDNYYENEEITFHSIKYTKFGAFLKKNNVNYISKIMRKIIKLILFPDILIFEKKNIVNEVLKICKSHNIDTVIGSGFPFTIESLGKEIKKTLKSVKFYYDIGDPFYGNSTNSVIKNFFAKRYEAEYLQYVDDLIVTNKLTAEHYKIYFSDIIKNISIIPMGATINDKEMDKGSSYTINNNKPLKIIYAGQLYSNIRNPKNIFKAIARFEDKINLDLYGSISSKFKITNFNANIKFHASISQDKLYSLYHEYDVILFLDNAYGMQMPGKVFELIQLKKPILVVYDNINSPSLEYFSKFHGCILVKNDKVEIEKTLNIFLTKKNNFIYNTNDFDLTWKSRAAMYANIINSNT